MDSTTDPELAAALQAAGLSLSPSPNAVDHFDRAFGPHPARPTDLADGAALFDRLTSQPHAAVLPFRSSAPPQTDAHYALAARNGGELSDAAQEAMRQARERDGPST